MKKILPINAIILGLLLILPVRSFSIQSLSEQELGEISGQDGATFIFDAFDFYMTSPGVEYLDVHPSVEYNSTSNSLSYTYPDQDDDRSSILFEGLLISDGNNGPVVMSGNLDFDGYTQTIDGVTYTMGRLDFYNLDLTMDIDVENIVIRPIQKTTGTSQPFDLGGMHIQGMTIKDQNIYFGAADNNTGLALEIDLMANIQNLQIDALNVAVDSASPRQVTFQNIMIAGYFDPVSEIINDPDNNPDTVEADYMEQPYDSSLPLPYTTVPGLWSNEKARDYATGASFDKNYYNELINANRYKPNWEKWIFDDIAHGCLKIGDIESGNPMRMDFTVDTNYYIPFPYDIVCGEPAWDDRVEWYEPVSGDFFTDARGWRDGKDNYLQDGTNYHPVRNPRYGKAYVSMDAHISGSLRMVSDNLTTNQGVDYTDVVMLEGVDLQIHTEIPGYGYGNTPNSIPRPYPNPIETGPRYDAPFGTGGAGNNGSTATYWPEATYTSPY